VITTGVDMSMKCSYLKELAVTASRLAVTDYI
jgi:hypothetical protein